MARQMLIDATRGKRTEKAPWVPYAGVNCAYLINEPADRYCKDPDILARGVVEAARTYHADGIPLMFDLSIEAEAMGCELEFWEDNVPSVRTHICEKKTPEELGLELFTRSMGRWPIIFEAAAKAKPQLDEMDCAMLGLVTGPLTLASHLAGVRIFTAVRKKKEFAHAVIAFAGKLCAESARLYAQMGCDIIAIVIRWRPRYGRKHFRNLSPPTAGKRSRPFTTPVKPPPFLSAATVPRLLKRSVKSVPTVLPLMNR